MSPARRRPLKVGVLLPHIEGMMAGATARWSDLLGGRPDRRGGRLRLHLGRRPPALPPARGRGEPVGVWEGWSLLAALAATTQRVELGTFVVCTGFRNPALLAKMADAVEEISGRRLVLGLGAGNNAFEHRLFGYPFDISTTASAASRRR